MKVYFIGAGPGDPELMTIKGKKIIEKADIIIYAGSLVNHKITDWAKEGTEIYNSAYLNLEEIKGIMQKGINEDKIIARIHTGDPSIYGAIQEQMDWLDEKIIDYELVPGVSSLFASTAALKRELTLPGITQTVILTRKEGRTSVPDEESLTKLAEHQATMAIFLSIGMIEQVVEELIQGGYQGKTPVAVVYKVSWPEEKIIYGDLSNIASRVKECNIDKTALIMVGDFINGKYENSRLYDKNFSHGYRQKV